MRNATWTLAITACLAASGAAAQQPPASASRYVGDLHAGDEVRFSAPSSAPGSAPMRGRLFARSGDTAYVRVGDSTTALPLESWRVEVRSKHRATATGAVIGGVFGMVAGIAIGKAQYQPCTPRPNTFNCLTDFGPGLYEVTGLFLGGTAGAVVGGLLGASIVSEKWTRVRGTTEVRPTIAPGGGGVRVGMRLSF